PFRHQLYRGVRRRTGVAGHGHGRLPRPTTCPVRPAVQVSPTDRHRRIDPRCPAIRDHSPGYPQLVVHHGRGHA
ncbi:MAG: hypothetical protein LW878_07920, partial [Proteobacteria bacterium]|nr:hypothetical protein [Pseudomonadota bacterium]